MESFTLFNHRPRPLEETLSPLYIGILVDMCQSDDGLFRLIGFLECRLMAQLDQWDGCPDWCRIELTNDIRSLRLMNNTPNITQVKCLLNRPRKFQLIQTRMDLTLACWKLQMKCPAEGETWYEGDLEHMTTAKSEFLICGGSYVVATNVLPFLFDCYYR